MAGNGFSPSGPPCNINVSSKYRLNVLLNIENGLYAYSVAQVGGLSIGPPPPTGRERSPKISAPARCGRGFIHEVISMPRRPGERYAVSRRKIREQRYNASRPARHGFYASPEWRRLRDWYRARNPLCEACQRQGRVTAAELVHHRVEISEGGAPLDPENLESLCWSCHSRVHGFNQG